MNVPHAADDAVPIGVQLRRIRGERGLTQEGLAERAGVSVDLIKKLEQGSRATARLATLIALANALDVSLSQLTDKQTALDEAQPASSAPPGRGPTVSAETGWRQMLDQTALLAAPGLAPRMGMDAFRAAGRVNPASIDDLAQVAAHYRRAYHAIPASRLLPAALAHLDLVLSLRPDWQPDQQRTTLLTTAGEMAALGGVLLGLDATQYQSALSYLDLAWSAAREALDVELQAVVLGCRSFALAYSGGDHRAGLECADFARDLAATGASAETRGWVAAVASEHCASLDDLSGCRERLDESRHALTGAADDGVTWRGIGGYGPQKLRAYEGGDMVRLRRYREAELILDDALSALDPCQQRHRATALIDRAGARLGGGDVDAACEDAAEALNLVTIVQHTGNLDRIEQLAARAAATGGSAGRRLRREVQLVRADQGLPTRSENL